MFSREDYECLCVLSSLQKLGIVFVLVFYVLKTSAAVNNSTNVPTQASHISWVTHSCASCIHLSALLPSVPCTNFFAQNT